MQTAAWNSIIQSRQAIERDCQQSHLDVLSEPVVGQRIFGPALGYEDLNDHDELRKTRRKRCWQAS
jgi:hypothetical protein